MTDQALRPTETCTKFGCDNAKLVRRIGGFWCCPKCLASYGADAKEGLAAPPADPRQSAWEAYQMRLGTLTTREETMIERAFKAGWVAREGQRG